MLSPSSRGTKPSRSLYRYHPQRENTELCRCTHAKVTGKILSLLLAPFTAWHPSVPKNPSPSRTKPRLPLDQGSLNCCAQGTNNREEKPEELDELCPTRSVFGNTDFKVA